MKKTIEDFFIGIKEAIQYTTKESIKDLENILKEIEIDEKEVRILFVDKKNETGEIVKFTCDEYMKEITKKMIFEGFKKIKEQHEEILEEI